MAEQVDRAVEYLRVRDHYRELTDGELLILARQISDLTDAAQQALASELSSRRLKPEAEKPAVTSRPEPPIDIQDPIDPNYDEDKRLVTICTVWSLADALQLQNLLDTAGIPFYIGPEKATAVDAVISNFADGLDFQIMSIGVPWARQAMQSYSQPMIELKNPKKNSTRHPCAAPNVIPAKWSLRRQNSCARERYRNGSSGHATRAVPTGKIMESRQPNSDSSGG